MRPVSDQFNAAVFSSHRRVTRVTDVNTGTVLPVVDGSVTLDITSATRGTVDLEIHDPQLIPQHPDDILAPYSNELRVERGVLIGGTPEYVQLGLFRVEDVETADSGSGVTIRVTAHDRSTRVIDAKFEDPYSIAGGTVVQTAIQTLIQYAFSGTAITPTFLFDSKYLVGSSTPMTTLQIDFEEGSDRWAQLQTLASCIGQDLFVDNDGVFRLKAIPSIDNTADVSIVEGVAGTTVSTPASLLDVTKRWTREDAYNRWIVVGASPSSSGAPPRSVATNDDPTMPTYYSGDFGHKPFFYSSSLLTSQAMTDEAALGMKMKEAGTSQSINFGSLVHPALEPGDVVRVTRTRRNDLDPTHPIAITDENHIIDSLTIPLGAGPMTCTGRGKKVI